MNIKTEYDAEIGPTEMLYETVNLPTPSKTISLWSNTETKQLMDLYRNLINEVGHQKRLKRKKDMWMEISTHFSNMTPKQCEERFKTVLKRKKNNFERVYISEARRKTIDLDSKEDLENVCQIIRRPKMEYNRDESLIKNFSAWSISETKLLVELYKHLICEVGPRKRLQHKKDMWLEISLNFTDKCPKQCEQRFNTVLKRKHHVYATKDKRKPIDFKTNNQCNSFQNNRNPNIENTKNSNEGMMEELNTQETYSEQLNKGPNLETMAEPTAKENETLNTQTSKDLTLHEVLLHIAAKREEGKERRHKEKLEAISKMQNILQQLLDIKKEKQN